MTDPSRTTRVPYPGLRPFRSDESDIFFGRERQIDELLHKLQKNRFLAVTGPSGCGKSSLIKAGVVPALHSGFMAEAGTRWRVVQMRPGDQPIRALAEALADPDILGDQQIAAENRVYVEAALRFGPLGLAETVAESPNFRTASLFLLVDQFEEIFRFRDRIDPDEADAFVRLLLETTARPGVPIYVVITMRSDYLGDCAVFHGLPEAINECQYLTPRLTREDCGSAIVGPARVFHGAVEPSLVNRLLNEFGPDPDRLPLLQHALMRMWQRHQPPQDEVGEVPLFTLTVEDYAAVGGIAEALSRHADEVYSELTAAQQRVAEIMFRRLTERRRGRNDTRAPARLGEVADVAQVDISEVVPVVEAFRGESRNFVTPAEVPLERETLLDIGHESLIRQWHRLAAWVEDEAESAATFLRLIDTAKRHKKQEAALLWGPDLELALAWETKVRPTEAWAKRYGNIQDYPDVITLLRASEKERDQSKARKAKREEDAKQRKIRVLEALAAALFLLLVPYASWNKYQDYLAEIVEDKYASWVKVHGVPRGIGKLTLEEAKRRALSFVITRRGRQADAPVIRMRAVDASGRPTATHSVGTLLDESAEIPAARKHVEWEFIYDQDGRIAYEVAFDKRKRQAWSFVYSPADRESRTRTAQFLGPGGVPLPRKQMCASSVTLEYSDAGYEKLLRYKDRFGNPVPGRDHAIVQERQYDSVGNLVNIISLDGHGKPMNDRVGNAVMKQSGYDRLGNHSRADALDKNGAPTQIRSGWASVLYNYDDAGNETEIRYLDATGRPTATVDGWHRRTLRYGERGLVASESYWAADGSPAVQKDYCHQLTWKYDERDRAVLAMCTGKNGKPSPGKAGGAKWLMEYDGDDNVTAWSYFDEDDKPVVGSSNWHRLERRYDGRGNTVSTSMLDAEGKPARHASGHSGTRLQYEGDREIRREFVGADGKPMLIAEGYASVAYSYDENGNRVRSEYFAADGKTPALLEDGYSAVRHEFDGCGQETERWFTDREGNWVTLKQKYAGYRITYDPILGLAVATEYLATDGRLAVSEENISGYVDTLDKLGNVARRRYFGSNRKSAVHFSGSAGWNATYDERGHRTSYEFVDPAGKLTMADDSRTKRFARLTSRLDSLGNTIEEAYFGSKGEAIEIDTGYARVQLAMDDRGGVAERAYFGPKGEPVLTRDGCHRQRWARDARGFPVEWRCFDSAGQRATAFGGFHRYSWIRDVAGRVVGERILGLNDHPIEGPRGWHYRQTAYDQRGNKILERYLTVSNKAVMVATRIGRCAALQWRHDAKDRTRPPEEICLDEQGRPVRR